MKPEIRKLAAVLRQIAHEAGHTMLCRGEPEITRFCTAQYNRIHARLMEQAPELAASFGPLPDDASAGEVRIMARALAAYIHEKTRQERQRTWTGVIGFAWPGCSLKFDFC